MTPHLVAEPTTGAACAAVLAAAAASRLSTVIRGGGTKSGWGRPVDAVHLVVSTKSLGNLLVHRDGDLTVTVGAGVTLARLNTTLSARGQWLPVDSAFVGATVGGALATNDSGPLRQRFGTPRDLLIGITLALTDGHVVKSGGTVVKNVAGYDLGKLVTGSLRGARGNRGRHVQAAAAAARVGHATDRVRRSASRSRPTPRRWPRGSSSRSRSTCAPATRPTARGGRCSCGLRRARRPSPRNSKPRAPWCTGSPPRCARGSRRAPGPSRWRWRGRVPPRLRSGQAPWCAAAGCRRDLARSWHWCARCVPSAASTLTGRVGTGTGLLRITGPDPSVAAAVERLRLDSSPVGHVVLLRGSRALRTQVDVWGAAPSAPAAALKRALDPTGILNAGRGPL